MNMTRFRELLRRDGWLYAAIALCVVLALSVSAISGSSPDEETRIARVLSEIAGAGSVSVTTPAARWWWRPARRTLPSACACRKP